MSFCISFLRFFRGFISTLALLAAGLSWAGPADTVLDETHAGVRVAKSLQNVITSDVMNWPEILGTAVGVNEAGEPDLVVYVEANSKWRADMVQSMLIKYFSIPVRTELTERFMAYRGKPGGGGTSGTSHTATQAPPIQLGTSGGWRSDLANGYCCGGTLGSLIQVNGVQYIMSNYHVFESDIVPGGNGVVATTGSAVIQPGLIDVNCNAASAQSVGTLVKLGSLPNSNVDVSVAQATSGMVRSDGAILEIGTLSSQTVNPSLNQAVKKSGRTTNLSRSHISGLNATVSVQYENECAGGVAFTKTYSGQVVVANSRSGFLGSGDSGSLMVEDITTKPRAVGLLFAGSSTSAIANPIGQVLSFVGGALGGTASMVGN